MHQKVSLAALTPRLLLGLARQAPLLHPWEAELETEALSSWKSSRKLSTGLCLGAVLRLPESPETNYTPSTYNLSGQINKHTKNRAPPTRR